MRNHNLKLLLMKLVFIRVFSLSLFVLLFLKNSYSQCGTAPGSGSNLTVTSPSQVLNTYYPGLGNPVGGATSLIVGNRTGSNTNIGNGDMVLIIQMQGAEFNSTNSDSY